MHLIKSVIMPKYPGNKLISLIYEIALARLSHYFDKLASVVFLVSRDALGKVDIDGVS